MQATLSKNPCQKGVSQPVHISLCAPVVSTTKSIAIIGSRSLSYELASKVGDVTEDIIERGYQIASGGAIGADQFCVERLLRLGLSDQATIYAAWKNYHGFPIKVRAMVRQFRSYGGSILWGLASKGIAPYQIKTALLQRNVRLVEACYGLVAFINGSSRGSIFTIKEAAKRKMPLVVFPFECALPNIPSVKWVALRCGGCYEGGFKASYIK